MPPLGSPMLSAWNSAVKVGLQAVALSRSSNRAFAKDSTSALLADSRAFCMLIQVYPNVALPVGPISTSTVDKTLRPNQVVTRQGISR